MKESPNYLREARIAVLLEKRRHYLAAGIQWLKASALAKNRINQHWADARAEYCNKYSAKEA
ncbi:ANR family transcriptional regulator [Vibrio scophthalmi]|uniref:ANR family transcriptional regulator n=1 Tax=Vibrio scophthalmi LMG 19158 TaxID=870967 RepID=F9RQ05_9VIBR|nr:ANR family transcriptional regulator [Vibrio scophthalmi]EGU34780.1 hypothetical protein VIS19158_03747 [Vibrio scophthalmi LMG 19158]